MDDIVKTGHPLLDAFKLASGEVRTIFVAQCIDWFRLIFSLMLSICFGVLLMVFA
jgi:hypothetical protein